MAAGLTIKLRAVESFGTLMVMYLMVSGRRTKRMASEFIPTPMERSMRANGSLTSKMDWVKKFGRMAAVMKATTHVE